MGSLPGGEAAAWRRLHDVGPIYSPPSRTDSLHTNRIGDDGCIMLSEALALHPSLQTLV